MRVLSKNSKAIPFERVLFALGIRYVGETVAKKLARHFKSLDALQRATYEELIAVDEIGERIAESILEYFTDLYNIQIVDRLKAYGLNFEIAEEELPNSQLLEGKAFVVSGVFHSLSRNDLKKEIEMNGGKVLSGVSAKTDYLIAGDNMGPSKRKKAEDLKVPIISEDDFLKMIEA